jgi:hypothetical protein
MRGEGLRLDDLFTVFPPHVAAFNSVERDHLAQSGKAL